MVHQLSYVGANLVPLQIPSDKVFPKKIRPPCTVSQSVAIEWIVNTYGSSILQPWSTRSSSSDQFKHDSFESAARLGGRCNMKRQPIRETSKTNTEWLILWLDHWFMVDLTIWSVMSMVDLWSNIQKSRFVINMVKHFDQSNLNV